MSSELDLKLPDHNDLLSLLNFSPESGQIWLSEQRMLLVHSSAMGMLRKELIETLGTERARAFLLRFGYQSGWKDAEMVHKVRPDLSKNEAYFVGPQLHSIEGQVKVTPVALDFDVEKQHFYCEMDWFNSYEADVHIEQFGLSDGPVCWTLLGYASGFTTYYMGTRVIFKETDCTGKGDKHCHIVGKPLEDWDDGEALDRLFLPDPVADELFALRQEVTKLRGSVFDETTEIDTKIGAVGQSASYKKACDLIVKAASSKVTVLLQGETGVGKEVLAKALHTHSDRADKPFVAVNCACLPPDLIEAELFGVEKGAYTGASETRPGKFERANTGTMFLDEVVELSPRAQASLLRVLQEGEFERVGDTKVRKLDVRIVTASNEQLKEAVNEGKFRADLFYRLNVFPVNIPPLRARKDDIPLLINHFIEKFNELYNKNILGLSDKAKAVVMEYTWPGNIRELENTIERGVILTDNNHNIDLDAIFPADPAQEQKDSTSQTAPSRQATRTSDLTKDDIIAQLLDSDISLDQIETSLVNRALELCDGNITHAANRLGITRSQMSYRLKKQ